uniref:Uncharacterized protein n=1 Tax=Rhizophora mucronata TaxID=61149 RepID=A0A2P2QPP5_RHIMU
MHPIIIKSARNKRMRIKNIFKSRSTPLLVFGVMEVLFGWV